MVTRISVLMNVVVVFVVVVAAAVAAAADETGKIGMRGTFGGHRVFGALIGTRTKNQVGIRGGVRIGDLSPATLSFDASLPCRTLLRVRGGAANRNDDLDDDDDDDGYYHQRYGENNRDDGFDGNTPATTTTAMEASADKRGRHEERRCRREERMKKQLERRQRRQLQKQQQRRGRSDHAEAGTDQYPETEGSSYPREIPGDVGFERGADVTRSRQRQQTDAVAVATVEEDDGEFGATSTSTSTLSPASVGATGLAVALAALAARHRATWIPYVTNRQLMLDRTLEILHALQPSDGAAPWEQLRGKILYAAGLMVWEFLGLSTIPVETAGGMVFGLRQGILYSGTGKVAGAIAAFLFGRHLFASAVRGRLRDHRVFQLLTDYNHHTSIQTCMLMKFSCFPEFVKNYGLALLHQVSPLSFVAATAFHGFLFTSLWTWLGVDTAIRLEISNANARAAAEAAAEAVSAAAAANAPAGISDVPAGAAAAMKASSSAAAAAAAATVDGVQRQQIPVNVPLRVALVMAGILGFVGSPLLMTWWIRDLQKQQGRIEEQRRRLEEEQRQQQQERAAAEWSPSYSTPSLDGTDVVLTSADGGSIIYDEAYGTVTPVPPQEQSRRRTFPWQRRK